MSIGPSGTLPTEINIKLHMKTLKDLFMEELADMYDAEQRIAKALPKVIEAATCPKLQSALQNHLEETESQAEKLESVFAAMGEKPSRQKCPAMVGILDEGEDLISDFKGSQSINAAVIAAAQKVEHYEIASYGCLHAWANLLKNTEAAEILEEILDEEKEADRILNELATAKNEEALEPAEAA
jgi:ferritin-like metal-binding protein YciE